MVIVMKNREKLWNKIQKLEKELLIAPPSSSAKLVQKIVKWKGQVFDE